MKFKFILFACLFYLFSCTREQGNRYHFLGNYSCIKTCSSWIMGQTTTYDTTYLNIEVLKDPNSRNGIIVQNDTIFLDENDSYTINQGSSYGYSISFRNDSIFISERGGGLGGQNNCNIKGHKQ